MVSVNYDVNVLQNYDIFASKDFNLALGANFSVSALYVQYCSVEHHMLPVDIIAIATLHLSLSLSTTRQGNIFP